MTNDLFSALICFRLNWLFQSMFMRLQMMLGSMFCFNGCGCAVGSFLIIFKCFYFCTAIYQEFYPDLICTILEVVHLFG